MAIELSEVMAQDGRVLDWADRIVNKNTLSDEDKEISNVMDAWAKKIGQTGFDANHEISALVRKSITPDTVTAPSDLIDHIFDTASIGEFDDYREEVEPKNTIHVYEATRGGNVDRSFINHKNLAPKWISLQAETDISLADMRRGGYRTVANMITYLREAMELKKYSLIMKVIDGAITAGANAITESTANPTATSMDALALYLHDVSDGDTPYIFGMNKYMQAIAKLTGVTTYLTDAVKTQFNTKGFVAQYEGCELRGISGQKKLPNGELLVPDKKIFGAAGKIGRVVTRGDSVVLQETDINSEKVHIKLGGYTFGTVISAPEKIAKITLA